MTSRPKAIGTRTETAVVRHVREAGFIDATRRAQTGSADCGDLWLCRGVIVEVKGGAMARAATPLDINRWAAEAEAERQAAEAEIGLLVVQRLNRANPGPGGWQAVLPLWAVTSLRTRDHIDIGLLTTPTGTLNRMSLSMTLDEALLLMRWAGHGERLPSDPVPLDLSL